MTTLAIKRNPSPAELADIMQWWVTAAEEIWAVLDGIDRINRTFGYPGSTLFQKGVGLNKGVQLDKVSEAALQLADLMTGALPLHLQPDDDRSHPYQLAPSALHPEEGA